MTESAVPPPEPSPAGTGGTPGAEGPGGETAAATPTPVRLAMDGGSSVPAADEVRAPERVIRAADGSEWSVRVVGSSVVGHRRGPSFPLLELRFSPNGTGSEGELRGLVPGRRLSDLDEEELVRALSLARPPAPDVVREDDDASPRRRRRW